MEHVPTALICFLGEGHAHHILAAELPTKTCVRILHTVVIRHLEDGMSHTVRRNVYELTKSAPIDASKTADITFDTIKLSSTLEMVDDLKSYHALRDTLGNAAEALSVTHSLLHVWGVQPTGAVGDILSAASLVSVV